MRFSNGRGEQLKVRLPSSWGEREKKGVPHRGRGKGGKALSPESGPPEQTRYIAFSQSPFIMEIPSEDGIFH